MQVSLLPFGDRVSGFVTLDVCGANFPSEQTRAARLQQVGRDKGGRQVVSDEHVRYLDANDAAAAVKEVRAAVAQCQPDEFHQPRVAGNPVVREQIDVVPNSQLKGLAPDRIALETTMTTRDGHTGFIVAIYQRRGAVLSAVYGATFDEILPFAHVIASRLNALAPLSAGDPPS